MKDLLNAGQVLGRSEMKKIMAGSGGGQSCTTSADCGLCYTCSTTSGKCVDDGSCV